MWETVNLLIIAAVKFRNFENDETQTLITEYFTPRLYTDDDVK